MSPRVLPRITSSVALSVALGIARLSCNTWHPPSGGSRADSGGSSGSDPGRAGSAPSAGSAGSAGSGSFGGSGAEPSDAATPRSDAEAGQPAQQDASTPDGGQVPPECAADVSDVSLDQQELAGYPPYAVDGCTLVYVSRTPAGEVGELRVRDLARGRESVLAKGDEAPRRPTVSGEVIAWEATLAGVPVVRVSYRGAVRTLSGAFHHAGEPRAAADGVAFTAWLSADPLGDSDVQLFLPESSEIVIVASGPQQQRFADISKTHVAFSDFSEDPDGHYDGDSNDLADIGVYDRATQGVSKRMLAGKQAFPLLLSGDRLAYLHWDWSEVHPEPKFGAYHLRSGALALQPGVADREIANVVSLYVPYVRPAALENTLEWVDSPQGTPRLWRAAADGSSLPSAVPNVKGVALYAPAPAAHFTILASRQSAELPIELTAVTR